MAEVAALLRALPSLEHLHLVIGSLSENIIVGVSEQVEMPNLEYVYLHSINVEPLSMLLHTIRIPPKATVTLRYALDAPSMPPHQELYTACKRAFREPVAPEALIFSYVCNKESQVKAMKPASDVDPHDPFSSMTTPWILLATSLFRGDSLNPHVFSQPTLTHLLWSYANLRFLRVQANIGTAQEVWDDLANAPVLEHIRISALCTSFIASLRGSAPGASRNLDEPNGKHTILDTYPPTRFPALKTLIFTEVAHMISMGPRMVVIRDGSLEMGKEALVTNAPEMYFNGTPAYTGLENGFSGPFVFAERPLPLRVDCSQALLSSLELAIEDSVFTALTRRASPCIYDGYTFVVTFSLLYSIQATPPPDLYEAPAVKCCATLHSGLASTPHLFPFPHRPHHRTPPHTTLTPSKETYAPVLSTAMKPALRRTASLFRRRQPGKESPAEGGEKPKRKLRDRFGLSGLRESEPQASSDANLPIDDLRVVLGSVPGAAAGSSSIAESSMVDTTRVAPNHTLLLHTSTEEGAPAAARASVEVEVEVYPSQFRPKLPETHSSPPE
ncbi:hypothetical protein NMY22_g6825 [Coprinellus aureogranulatus]|nr:hypothetical protein NMY22_g6825 [Coprinellus aureogranulatus]